MLTQKEFEEFAEIDRLAHEEADRLGRRLNVGLPEICLIAVAVFILLGIFTILIGLPLDAAVFPRIALTVGVAGLCYLAIRLRENSWYQRYQEALKRLQSEKWPRTR